jgi:hypothetical protein
MTLIGDLFVEKGKPIETDGQLSPIHASEDFKDNSRKIHSIRRPTERELRGQLCTISPDIFSGRGPQNGRYIYITLSR